MSGVVLSVCLSVCSSVDVSENIGDKTRRGKELESLEYRYTREM